MFVTSPVFLDSNFLCEVEEQKQQKLTIKILDRKSWHHIIARRSVQILTCLSNLTVIFNKTSAVSKTNLLNIPHSSNLVTLLVRKFRGTNLMQQFSLFSRTTTYISA